MTLDLAFFAVAVPAVLLAGISKGGFGSGAAFAATPLLALALPPAQAVGLMLPLLMVMDLTGIRPYWRKWDWRSARGLMVAAVPGIGLGWLLFRAADPDVIKFAVGAIAVGFVLFQAAKGLGWLRSAPRPYSHAGAGVAGFAAGFTSFVSHAGGPPVSMFLLGQGLDKLTFQATTMLVFWWINLVKMPPYLALGLVGRETLLACILLVPAAILGTLAGVWLHSRMPERPFFLLIYVLLTVTGLKLMWDALA